MPAPKPPQLEAEFDDAMAALLAVKPPPSGKKATARRKKRDEAKNDKNGAKTRR
jgi:hypothetical protein